MIEITLQKANLMRESFACNQTNIKALEMSYRDGKMFMTVDRMRVGVTEYVIVDYDTKDHEIAIHINNLRNIAVKYAGTQQLRAQLRKEVLTFMGREE
jgi:hypothetical protein